MDSSTLILPKSEDSPILFDERRFEVVDGVLRERKMGAETSYVAAILLGRILDFVLERRLGWCFTTDGGYQCFPDRPKLVRFPDVSFVRHGRLPEERPPKGHMRLAPDLAVEVVSPNDLYYEIEQKIEDYLSVGVPLVWVVNPEVRTVHVYRPDGSVTRLRRDQR
ncbi:MAG TPA: Uma2 family endonuclease, partial [Gemmataceae bacterium]